MKSLDIEFIDIDKGLELDSLDCYFNKVKVESISTLNWKEFNYLPKVSFQIFYSKNSVYIKYEVSEQSVLAEKLNSNDPVCQDSCVEFFISPGDGKYYNFEFSCIGTRYTGAGVDRSTSRKMPVDVVEKIRTFSSLGTTGFSERREDTTWSLIVQIPFEIFTNKAVDEIKGSSMRANFYKCGDSLSVPHFVTWNSIKAENPDFHRPECFGNINFK